MQINTMGSDLVVTDEMKLLVDDFLNELKWHEKSLIDNSPMCCQQVATILIPPGSTRPFHKIALPLTATPSKPNYRLQHSFCCCYLLTTHRTLIYQWGFMSFHWEKYKSTSTYLPTMFCTGPLQCLPKHPRWQEKSSGSLEWLLLFSTRTAKNNLLSDLLP